jgi:hypothetical protein
VAAVAERIKVTFSDACTDVLVHLADQPADSWRTWHGIRDAIAPGDATDPNGTVLNAMQTLRDCGLIEGRSFDGFPGWRITDAGRKAVADAQEADAKASEPMSDLLCHRQEEHGPHLHPRKTDAEWRCPGVRARAIFEAGKPL